MKILFVGLGSIGQRHLINLKKVMDDDVEILAYRETNHNMLIINGVGKECGSLKQYYGFREFNNLDDALKESPNLVFVTNPTSRHLETALKAATCDCDLFIEKPLSDSLGGTGELRRQIEGRNLVVTIGYQTRFHPCYKLVRTFLSEKKYGNVISANFEWGTYLPSHHSYEDYRRSYAAVKSLGGGVVLGLIHEVDLIYSLWGQPKNLFAIRGRSSALKMDVEDTVSVLMRFEHNKRIFPVALFLSYAQTKETRKFRIQLDKATIFCNLLENTVRVFDETGRLIAKETYPEVVRNSLFLDEMKEFMSAVKERRKPLVCLDDGIESLKLAMEIRGKILE